jgi:NADP-dependent 3-hydroxy acid dehydrogenase YdfG
MNIFITGASSGIGSSTVRALCYAGHNVFGVARRKEALQALADECALYDGGFQFITGDVRDLDTIKKAVKQAIDSFSSIDVLIPNAGIGYFNPLDEGTMEEWESMVDVNVTGVLRTIHTALPHLLKSKGHIINIGSVAARQVFPNSGVYCSTKHAILAMSEALRIEFSGKLAITTINPGAVNTPFIDRTQNEELKKEYRPNFDKGMSPDFVADTILKAIQAGGRGIISEITLRPDHRQ